MQEQLLTINGRKALLRTPDSSKEVNVAVILIHGGCFHQGDETWNKEQAIHWVEHFDMIVLTMDFRQSNQTETMEDLNCGIVALKNYLIEMNIAVGVIGCSSGGYFSYRLSRQFCESKIDFAIAICPVVFPSERYEILKETNDPIKSKLMDKQKSILEIRWKK
jgi:acetyl esterase/lipase